MQRKAIATSFILLLMTEVISAQENSGSSPFRPGLNIKNDVPSRSKEQKEYDKAIDREYQSKLKELPEAAKKDPWGNIRPGPPPAAAKNKQ